jgi:phosphoesterase RecJ-like protein
MTNEVSLEAAAARVAEASSVMLTTHVSPDGDGIGSGLGLVHGLRALGKDAALVMSDPVPPYLSFLPGSDGVRHGEPNREHWDVVIGLDCGEWERLGEAVGDRGLYGTVINLDHHRSNSRYGDLNVVQPTVSATGLMAYNLLKELGAPLSAEAALPLYTALTTDTGFFCYSNTDAATLKAAAELVAAGASPNAVHHALHENRSAAQLRLTALALNALEYHAGGRIGLIPLTADLFEESGAGSDDTEGLVDFPRSVQEVEVAVLMKVDDTDPFRYKVSLRSKQYADVARIAETFGGGGHARAAGCRLEGELDEVKARLVEAIRAELA